MNSEHSFEFQFVLSKPIGIWVWTLKQSSWSFYFEQVCLKDLVEILNGLGEFLKKRKTALSYSNLPWPFSPLLSLLTGAAGFSRRLREPGRANSWLADSATSVAKPWCPSPLLGLPNTPSPSQFVFLTPSQSSSARRYNSPPPLHRRPIQSYTSFTVP